MPTIIAIDSSLSMCRCASLLDDDQSLLKRRLAEICTIQILDHLCSKTKLEHTSILSFSSDVHQICEFTRDYNQLKSSLTKISTGDCSYFSTIVSYLNEFVAREWGSMEPCHVIIITDGRISWTAEDNVRPSTDLFRFQCDLHFLCLETMQTLTSSGCMVGLENFIKENEGKGSVSCLFKPRLSDSEVVSTLKSSLDKFLNQYMNIFTTVLCCGNLKNNITVFPVPVTSDSTFKFGDEFSIMGFLNISEIGNPPVISRHLLLPVAKNDSNESKAADSGSLPSFSVVLHGSLKVKNKVALVKVSRDWFGIIQSWADSKTKSNLVLSLLRRGHDPVPWIGDIRQLGPASLLPAGGHSKKADIPSFPIAPKKGIKRSYAQPTVAWTRPTGLQTDVQKILRSAKKLPEKSQIFYKELNRLRRAALSFGFHELLEGISLLLERECTLLPGTAHPEATLQLSHAARELKSSINSGYDHLLEPLKTDFKFKR